MSQWWSSIERGVACPLSMVLRPTSQSQDAAPSPAGLAAGQRCRIAALDEAPTPSNVLPRVPQEAEQAFHTLLRPYAIDQILVSSESQHQQ